MFAQPSSFNPTAAVFGRDRAVRTTLQDWLDAWRDAASAERQMLMLAESGVRRDQQGRRIFEACYARPGPTGRR